MKGNCETHGPWENFDGMCVPCATAAMPDEDIMCPFCGRRDYDKIGLKHHLGQCEAMDAVERLPVVQF